MADILEAEQIRAHKHAWTHTPMHTHGHVHACKHMHTRHTPHISGATTPNSNAEHTRAHTHTPTQVGNESVRWARALAFLCIGDS